MEYRFTRPEQQAIERAAKLLKHVMTDTDAKDAAYDIENEIREALVTAARDSE